MAKVPSADEIRQLLQKTHPADHGTVLAGVLHAPIKAAQESARQSAKEAEKAEKKAEGLSQKMRSMQVQATALSKTLAIRQRMTPQDLRDALMGMFESYNFSPAEELVQMLADPMHPHFITDPRLRVNVLQDLNSYVMPKLKSTEVKGNVEHNHTITIIRIGDDGKRIHEERALPVEAEVKTERGITPNG